MDSSGRQTLAVSSKSGTTTAVATRWQGGGVRCWHMVVADSKGGGRGGGSNGGHYPSLHFFCYHCGRSFYLAYVEFHSRNTNKGNILLFPLSQEIHPAACGIHPEQRNISIDMKTVVTQQQRCKISLNCLVYANAPAGQPDVTVKRGSAVVVVIVVGS